MSHQPDGLAYNLTAVAFKQLDPQNPKPQGLNPQTLNPKPLNPQPQSRNLEPSTLKPSNLQPSTDDLICLRAKESWNQDRDELSTVFQDEMFRLEEPGLRV